MSKYRTRFHGQVDLATAEELAEFWREEGGDRRPLVRRAQPYSSPMPYSL